MPYNTIFIIKNPAVLCPALLDKNNPDKIGIILHVAGVEGLLVLSIVEGLEPLSLISLAIGSFNLLGVGK